MIALAKKSGRRYIIGSAIDDLIPTWSRIGFERTGYRYFNYDIGGKIHEMMILDLVSILAGNCDNNFYQAILAALNAPIYTEEIQAILLRPWEPNCVSSQREMNGDSKTFS